MYCNYHPTSERLGFSMRRQIHPHNLQLPNIYKNSASIVPLILQVYKMGHYHSFIFLLSVLIYQTFKKIRSVLEGKF
jgi:hypothetical protein